ncbi:MAG: hypothetical protein ACREQK_11485, partial [Candidatus Binatia bacterium]
MALADDSLRRSRAVLKQLCDGVLSHTVLDPGDPWYGGVRCYLDRMIETRGAEACYAMALIHRETGDSRYLACARAMVEFLLRSQAANGWWTNDGTSVWRGITVFQTMALQETYFLLKEI